MDQRTLTDEQQHTHAFVPGEHHGDTARRLLRIGTVVAVVALLAAAFFVYRAHHRAVLLRQATEAQALVVVSTTHPAPITDDSDLVMPGNLQANYEAPIYARTSGYLSKWLVDIGARVRSGQLLAVIESPEVDQQLSQAQADLANAIANQQIADVTATRWRNLRESDSVSKQEADEKISAAQAADAQVLAARANVDRLRALAGFERIVAPFNGIITARETDVGQLINAGSGNGPEMFRIADEERLRLYVRVPQADSRYMTQGLKVEVRLPDRPDQKFSGILDTTASAIDPASRTMLVEVLIDNHRHELLPGAYAEVHFELPAAAPGSFMLPSNVLLFRGDGLHVATVDGQGHVVLKAVQLGRDYGSSIEVVSGITASDNVILSPPDSITSGVAVRVVKPRQPGTAPSKVASS
ncbi:MAG TPA: efflux RND transporter periplasmic adaptor subunit [Steroidobacteraceae bacterium]|nr:efflux RND transporter periplasmic adaptor subunit [Steroidobacteraceae bacterium]